ncbi:MAG: hypothetical protein FJ291_23235 [Planctomycetes bacterium]|nr:hypothetical protein [Planctomycetota bacterium]
MSRPRFGRSSERSFSTSCAPATGLGTDEEQGQEMITLCRVSMVKITRKGEVLLGELPPPEGGKIEWVPKGSCYRGELVTFVYRPGAPPEVIELPQSYYDPLGPPALERVRTEKDLSGWVHRVTAAPASPEIDSVNGLQQIRAFPVIGVAASGGAKVDLGKVPPGGKLGPAPIGTCRVGELTVRMVASGWTNAHISEVVELPDDYFGWVGKDAEVFTPAPRAPSAPRQPPAFRHAAPKPRRPAKQPGQARKAVGDLMKSRRDEVIGQFWGGSARPKAWHEALGGFPRDLANNQGRSEGVWLSPKGKPTTGVGRTIPDSDSFKKMGWVHRNPGEPATPDELQTAWDTLERFRQEGKFGPHYPPQWFERKLKFVLPDEKVNELFILDALDTVQELGAALGKEAFLAMPEAAQEALVDVAFSLRPDFTESAVWKTLAPAVAKADWPAAANACRRPEAGDRRNQWTKAKFEEAAKEPAAPPAK